MNLFQITHHQQNPRTTSSLLESDMSRKRDKPYSSSHPLSSYSKRRRPPPPEDDPLSKPSPPAAVVVMGLPEDCSVLDLKSRFEIYGSISRIRIGRDSVGHIIFRSKDSAEAAVAAARDSSFGVTIGSKRVQVLWATDPLAKWREGVGAGAGNEKVPSPSSSSSKLLRAELPLRRHGRVNKVASAVVNPRSGSSSTLDKPFRGREIIAYDDIL